MSLDEPQPLISADENRDPNSINTHAVVTFPEVIAEPDDSHSAKWAWVGATRAFEYTLFYTYQALSVIFSFMLAACWGLKFALVSFVHIWLVTPTLEFVHINILAGQRLIRMLVHCLCDPFWESVGLLLSRVRVETHKET